MNNKFTSEAIHKRYMEVRGFIGWDHLDHLRADDKEEFTVKTIANNAIFKMMEV